MGQETSTPTTSEIIQTALASLTQFQTALTNLNTVLTALSITNITCSPTVTTTTASVNAVTL